MTDIMTLHEPPNWQLYRLGQLFHERKEKVSDKDYPPLSVTMNGIVPQLETAAKSDDGDNRKLVKVGDYVINSRSDRKGSGGISSHDGSVSLISIVLKPKNVHPRFAHHLLRSRAFQEEFYRWGHGIVADLWTTRFADMKNIRMYLPDLESQKAIADFLDRETARIDQLIDKKQQLVGLLKEKYKAEKKRLVFDLDNQLVERSASAVSWFPDLPSHWRFMRSAHLFNNLDSRRIPLSAEKRGDLAKIYPYYGASGIIDAVDDYLFDEDTILVGEDGANLVMQSTPIAFKASGKYWVNNHAHILTPRFGDFDYWIHALNEVPYEVFVTGSAQPKLTSAVLGNIRLPVPPSEEQTEIASRIEAMGLRVNAAIDPVLASIERLKEYRAALITASVTGQIDVETWGKSGHTDRRLDQIEEDMALQEARA